MPTVECEHTKVRRQRSADDAYMDEGNFFTTPLYPERLKYNLITLQLQSFFPLPERSYPSIQLPLKYLHSCMKKYT